VLNSPAFGQADLTNCERELIHLAGSVQPHGVLLAVQEPALTILQVSANCKSLLGMDSTQLLGQSVELLGGNAAAALQALAGANLSEPMPLCCELAATSTTASFEGTVHRIAGGVLLVEIEPVQTEGCDDQNIGLAPDALRGHINDCLRRFSSVASIAALTDAVVRGFRDMLGYDRVMVYKFDPEGHGKIIAEARDPRLDSLLGHHYPASDIPQRARELYLRNRLRVLVDVHYEPAPLLPRQLPGSGTELDMSLCQLRSMSPLHLQYLKNMGVTATLVASLVRDGKLWGLVACHHYSPLRPCFALRSAAELLAEIAATRIAAIENYAHAQVAIQVRRLEQRLIEATSTEGDWRAALFRNPHTLLAPLEATGAALFHEGEVLTCGEVPSTAELRALLQWVDRADNSAPFSCNSVARSNPALDSLTPMASGVLAIKLSAARPDFLMWFRKEQLQTVTWAGDPSKPVINNDPLTLSPRRSFAAWSELVRGTALPWTAGEVAMGRAFAEALIDIIVQVNAVRLLIAEHQQAQIRAAVSQSREPALVADATGRVILANEAFLTLVHWPANHLATLERFASLVREPALVQQMLTTLTVERHAWRGEMDVLTGRSEHLNLAVRADLVTARDGAVLGYFLIFADQTGSQRAQAARQHLEQSLWRAGHDDGPSQAAGTDELVGAILSSASLAAMDIADGNSEPTVAGLLQELEVATLRATALYAQMRRFSEPGQSS
jgi:light-regulated signal transduction histidine kinase (bacteriophytochrome)